MANPFPLLLLLQLCPPFFPTVDIPSSSAFGRKKMNDIHHAAERRPFFFTSHFSSFHTPARAKRKRTKTTDPQITCHLSRGIGLNETPSIRDWRAKIRGRRAEKKENKKHESRLQNVT
jgi:hypothetical protein